MIRSLGEEGLMTRVRSGLKGCAPIVLLTIGCSPLVGDSGCGSPPPRATDAVATAIGIQSLAPPCTFSSDGVRGSDGHLIAHLDCPGESDPFLVAIKVDGKLRSLVEVKCAGYGTQVAVDAGAWEAADTLWHSAELVVDPLNLFPESNEANNRLAGQVRTIAPSIGVFPLATRFLDPGAGYGETSQIEEGKPVLVVMTALVQGRYRSFELSAKSGTALDVAVTKSFDECAAASGGAPQVSWDWTPPGPGLYLVEFRVTVSSGEVDSNPGDNLLTRELRVVPQGTAAHARPASAR
jgi:hypothetical protein